MRNPTLDKNGLDKFGKHWIQYAEFVLTAFFIYFGWTHINDASFRQFAVKIFKFWILMDITLNIIE